MRNEIAGTLVRALGRSLTDEEISTNNWLGDCEMTLSGDLERIKLSYFPITIVKWEITEHSISILAYVCYFYYQYVHRLIGEIYNYLISF